MPVIFPDTLAACALSAGDGGVMRQPFDSNLLVRAPAPLLAELRAKAAERETTMSAMVRKAIRREVEAA